MNFVDISVLIELGISALVGVSSGFVKMLLWVLSWIGAVIATILLYPYVLPTISKHISEPILANIATGVGIFVVALIFCFILNGMISRLVRASSLGALDRSLGLLFGLALGTTVICGAYMLLAWAIRDPNEWPDTVRTARVLPLVETGARYLETLLPPDLLEIGEAAMDQGVKTLEKTNELNQQYNNLNQGGQTGADSGTHTSPASGAVPGAVNPGGQAGETGYNDAERNDLNRMIQTTQ